MFFLDFSFFILIFVALTRSQEFIRVGYYVSNEYTDPELQETPPGKTFAAPRSPNGADLIPH